MNPRRCDPQRFSRPPQSAALPSLREKTTADIICQLRSCCQDETSPHQQIICDPGIAAVKTAPSTRRRTQAELEFFRLPGRTRAQTPKELQTSASRMLRHGPFESRQRRQASVPCFRKVPAGFADRDEAATDRRAWGTSHPCPNRVPHNSPRYRPRRADAVPQPCGIRRRVRAFRQIPACRPRRVQGQCPRRTTAECP